MILENRKSKRRRSVEVSDSRSASPFSKIEATSSLAMISEYDPS
jgi:hypothetical protein